MTDFTRAILTPRIKVGRDVVQKAQTKEQVMMLFMLQTSSCLPIQAPVIPYHVIYSSTHQPSIYLPTCSSIHPITSYLFIHHSPTHPHISSTIHHPLTCPPTLLYIHLFYPLTLLPVYSSTSQSSPIPLFLYLSICSSIHPFTPTSFIYPILKYGFSVICQL